MNARITRTKFHNNTEFVFCKYAAQLNVSCMSQAISHTFSDNKSWSIQLQDTAKVNVYLYNFLKLSYIHWPMTFEQTFLRAKYSYIIT
jgi:hypothetical protein